MSSRLPGEEQGTVLGGAFYPSMVTHLTLRFDETLDVIQDEAALAKFKYSSELEARGARAPSGSISIGAITAESGEVNTRFGDGTTASSGGVKRTFSPSARLEAAAQRAPGLAPLVPAGDVNLSRVNERVPVQATVEMTGVRQAWKFSLKYDFRDLPIDPRLLRACGVEVHLGAVPAGDYGKGMAGLKQRGRRLSQISSRSQGNTPAGGDQAGTPNIDTLLMHGTVDSWSVEHAEDGSWVTIEGRDLRGLLLDIKPPLARLAELDLSKPIDDVVSQVIQATFTADYDVDMYAIVDPSEWAQGVPSPAERDGLTRVRLEADGAGSGQSTPKGDGISAWDIITRYCFLCGAIPYFLGTDIWIRPARSIYQAIKDPSYPVPFAGGRPRTVKTESGREELRFRRLVYGRDIRAMSYERKFAGSAMVPTVVVVSIDDTKRGDQRLISAQWPPEDSVAAKLKSANETITVPVGGIRDKARLLTIAHDLYEEIGHGEMGGSCSTDALASFGGSNADPDLLRLRPTDTVELVTDARALQSRAPQASSLLDHTRQPFEQEVAEIAARIGDELLARAIVATARGGVVADLRFFRVANVRYGWSERGLKVDFDFQNYVTARQGGSAETAATTGNEADKPPVQKRRIVKMGKGVKGDTTGAGAGGGMVGGPLQGPPPGEVRLRSRLKAMGLSDAQVDAAIKRTAARREGEAQARDARGWSPFVGGGGRSGGGGARGGF